MFVFIVEANTNVASFYYLAFTNAIWYLRFLLTPFATLFNYIKYNLADSSEQMLSVNPREDGRET